MQRMQRGKAGSGSQSLWRDEIETSLTNYQELGLEFAAKRLAVKACKSYAGATLTLHHEHLVEPHPVTTRADALASLDVIERHADDSCA